MKPKEFIYNGEPVPELDEQEHALFFMNLHKALLLSLEKRSLLTHLQCERCLAELNKKFDI